MIGFAEEGGPRYGAPMSKSEFLLWVQRQERRYELVRGAPRMQAGGSKAHARIVSNFVIELGARIDRRSWSVTPSDVAVEIGDEIRYPDVLVEVLGEDCKELATNRPIVLIEVLSPSSIDLDMKVKLGEYTELATLQTYVVASQDEAKLWVWHRDPATAQFPLEPEEIKGRRAPLDIPALGVQISLAELYRSIPVN